MAGFPFTNDLGCSGSDARLGANPRARIWGHLSLPGFEPPLSGPGPALNKSSTRQVVGGDGRPVPNTNGALVSSIYQFVGDYSKPLLRVRPGTSSRIA